jgi:pantoate--beta-alanine ligase
MVEDLNFDVDIVVCPTIRERDGLAMSSRNLYLNEDERRAATLIYQVLKRAEEMVLSGESFEKVRDFMNKTLAAEPLIKEIQYASLFHPEGLEELSTGNISLYKEDSLVLAAAVVLGNARLIDNIVVDLTK